MPRAIVPEVMFIIARRRGQRIEIGEEIAITVTEISRNCVKLGIEAPRNCLIARGELKESVALANHEAAACNVAPAPSILNHETRTTDTSPEVTGADSFLLSPVKTLASLDVSKATEEAAMRK